MLEIIFRLIPKATNEIIFVLGVIGLCILCLKKKKSIYLHILLFLVFGMTVWRVFYRIDSSRYVSIFIYFFCIFTAYFLTYLGRLKKAWYSFFALLIGIGVVVFFICKSYKHSQNSFYLRTLAEVHSRNNKTEKNLLIANIEDAIRLEHFEKEFNPFGTHYASLSFEALLTFIKSYRDVGKGAMIDIVDHSAEKEPKHGNYAYSNYKQIVNIYSTSKKKHCIYLVRSNFNCSIISNSDICAFTDPGLLDNGTLNELDDQDTSFSKLKKHIGKYEQFCQYDTSLRTPVNAYFFNNPDVTPFHPFYNCSADNAISCNSANIRIETGTGYLLFYQKFHNGTYDYSVMLKGDAGTSVTVVIDPFKSGKWQTSPLASFTIPNSKMTYQIKTSFSISSLGPSDYFLVGATVSNGSAILDNFYLSKK